MADRADTGARERLAAALEREMAQGFDRCCDVLDVTYAELASLLAAGVGVPPDEDSVSAPHKEREDAREPGSWRVGRKVGRTIYQQTGAEPTDNDPLIGVMDTRELAALAVAAVNAALSRSGALAELEASEARARAARFPNPEPAGVGEARPAEPPQTYPADDLPAFGTQLRFAARTIKDLVSALRKERGDARGERS